MTEPSDIISAIQQIAEEKNIPVESIIETIELALAAAYRKDFGNKLQNIKVTFDTETGGSRVYDIKTTVEDRIVEEYEKEQEERRKLLEQGIQPEIKNTEEEESEEEVKFNPKTMIGVTEAQSIQQGITLGEKLKQELEVPSDYGRMAAQTAKQVIIQKIREAERETIYQKFLEKKNELVTGMIQRVEPRVILVDIDKTTAILPLQEQIENEDYRIGNRLKFYIKEVNQTSKGPEIIISRSHPEMIRKLFNIEVPEITSGTVVIKAISREAGQRSKIAVLSKEENIDPIGACVGQRGTRVQTIINELGGEKIDIIEYSESQMEFIANALSPAKVLSVQIDEENKTAQARVKEDQLSLAIGKGGQNVRLAARLTGWRIDVVEEGGGETKTTPNDEVGADEKANDEQTAQETNDTEETETPSDDHNTHPEQTDDSEQQKKTTNNQE